jgi:hypothetical protein
MKSKGHLQDECTSGKKIFYMDLREGGGPMNGGLDKRHVE